MVFSKKRRDEMKGLIALYLTITSVFFGSVYLRERLKDHLETKYAVTYPSQQMEEK